MDWALGKNHPKIVHMLVAARAPLQDKRQDELEEYLKAHPFPQLECGNGLGVQGGGAEQTWSWMPPFVLQQMQRGSLKQTTNDEIKQLIREGKLPCKWTHDLGWRRVSILTQQRTLKESYQKEIIRLEEEEHHLTDQLHRVQLQLQKVREQQNQCTQDMQDYAHLVSIMKLEELSDFATRAESIENALMSALEAELDKKKPTLSALTDLQSPQPKLSLFLNRMGTPSEAIHALRDLDSTMFHIQTKSPLQFMKQYESPQVSHEMIKDLLYCGEILYHCHPPCVDHQDKCPVCLNRTAEELIRYLQEIGVVLDSNTLRKNQMNGRRVLFSLAHEFPHPESATQALDRLRDIHEEAMRTHSRIPHSPSLPTSSSSS